eukprot:Gb_35061 [translate_table: standard]
MEQMSEGWSMPRMEETKHAGLIFTTCLHSASKIVGQQETAKLPIRGQQSGHAIQFLCTRGTTVVLCAQLRSQVIRKQHGLGIWNMDRCFHQFKHQEIMNELKVGSSIDIFSKVGLAEKVDPLPCNFETPFTRHLARLPCPIYILNYLNYKSRDFSPVEWKIQPCKKDIWKRAARMDKKAEVIEETKK